jgi:hypothetical protein
MLCSQLVCSMERGPVRWPVRGLQRRKLMSRGHEVMRAVCMVVMVSWSEFVSIQTPCGQLGGRYKGQAKPFCRVGTTKVQ